MIPTTRGWRKVSFGGRLHRYHQVSKQDSGRRWKCDKSSAAFECQGFVTTDTKETGALVLNHGKHDVACDQSPSGIHADGDRREIACACLAGAHQPSQKVAGGIEGVGNGVLSMLPTRRMHLKVAQNAKKRAMDRAYRDGEGGEVPNCRPLAQLVFPNGPTEQAGRIEFPTV